MLNEKKMFKAKTKAEKNNSSSDIATALNPHTSASAYMHC